jgi:hypothetical protein
MVTLYFQYFFGLTYLQRAHLINPMVPGLHGGKMSSSDEGIDIPHPSRALLKNHQTARSTFWIHPRLLPGRYAKQRLLPESLKATAS